jgi:hypothetical protein
MTCDLHLEVIGRALHRLAALMSVRWSHETIFRWSLMVWLTGFAGCFCDDVGQREVRARQELSLLLESEVHFRLAVGRAPLNLEEMAPPACTGRGCVLGKIPIDPWGHAYRSELNADHLRFFSRGPDGVWGSGDDLSAW